MKPAPFDYVCPRTLPEAVKLLQDNEGAKIISGGQSLMPLLAFRLAQPTLLVDIRKIEGLNRIEIADDEVILGARVRWVDIEKDCRLQVAAPLVSAAIAHVAHYQIRNRGTVGGSVVHADPAAEMPGVTVAHDAQLDLIGPSGTRTVEARDFFLGPLQTAIKPEEVLVRVRFARWTSSRRWAFDEFAQRRGDFALAGVLLHYDVSRAGAVEDMHVAGIGIGDRPQRLPKVEAYLAGKPISWEVAVEAGKIAASSIEPFDDLHASADYRRSLFGALVERSLQRSTGQQERALRR